MSLHFREESKLSYKAEKPIQNGHIEGEQEQQVTRSVKHKTAKFNRTWLLPHQDEL